MLLAALLLAAIVESGPSSPTVTLEFESPVLVADPHPDASSPPNYVTPNPDGFFSVGEEGQVILSGWNQGLTFAATEDGGATWNRTILQSTPFYAGGNLWLVPASTASPTKV